MNIIAWILGNYIHYKSDWSVENYEWQCLLAEPTGPNIDCSQKDHHKFLIKSRQVANKKHFKEINSYVGMKIVKKRTGTR